MYLLLIGSTITINTFFIIYKGAKGLGLHKTPLSTAFIVAFGAGGIVSIITIPIVPKLKQYVYKLNNANNNLEYDADNEMEIYNETEIDDNKLEYNVEMIKMNIIEKKKTLNIKNVLELERIEDLHNNAEKFDENLEGVFKYLQIFTAICDSFSHGANDVANAIGPFVTIYTIYTTNELSKKNDMEEDAYWILALGGVGIAIGLYIYGTKITYAIGEKLCKITPSRGVAIELSSALVIITGSRLQIPLSTTHCQVGATVGVGLLEDTKKCKGINCKIFYQPLCHPSTQFVPFCRHLCILRY